MCMPTSHASPFSKRVWASLIWTWASRSDLTSLPRNMMPASMVSRMV